MTQQTSQNQQNVTPHTVPLTATIVGNKVKISGDGSATLPKDTGAHRFDFTVTSPAGTTVQFASLDSEDECSTCPPAAGQNSTQIVAVKIGTDTASFTNKNNNQDGPIDVSYQWNFTCSDPKLKVEPFDPIIRNGGSSTPPLT
jgi:hypothetical protein